MRSELEPSICTTRASSSARTAPASASRRSASLLARTACRATETGGLAGLPHFAPKAKRVIFLLQSGGPSQLDLFDYKPALAKFHGTQISRLACAMGQRITGMTLGPDAAAGGAARMFKFSQHGQSGTWVSELLPHTAKIVDDITVIKSMNTDAINHDPAITFIQTGSQQPGRPSMGAWLSYGLGSENQNLPAFVVLLSQAQRAQRRPAAVLAAVGQRVPAVAATRASGSAPAATGAVPRQSARHRRETTRATMLDAVGEAQPRCSSSRTAIRRSRRASRSTRWRTGCRPRCRS